MKKKVNNTTTEKESGSATLTRVRDNQRRSRARRKEYIQHLEERLRSFESLGVAASQEVQQAGRKVAKENALLRSLLVLRGVTQDEIEVFLKSHEEYTPGGMTRSASAISYPVTPQIRPSMVLGVSQGTPCESPNTLPWREVIDKRIVPAYGRSVEFQTYANQQELTTGRPPTILPVDIPDTASTLQQFNGDHREKGHFTSCESAARIIADLRGYSDTHELRSELGCGAEADCMVKNLNLFEMFDK
ncbi:uncharacterized protein N7496_000446 [Penicillium cataractarum]|uniref:BZIP domain-containing protein n=1 Tax=Penicillium cataractarum TaxID=2100454 RepID=A0A9W9VU96_9EURO|nr:uncharacterized protein N7496_000446 [Penicillium cataractarum]KAJ5389378.1 hypothetical protein N7496_000446 [Penicillium cataractarum]